MKSHAKIRVVVLIVITAFIVQCFIFLPRSGINRDLEDEEAEFVARLKGPLEHDDPQLIQIVRQDFLEPPSELPYNFTHKNENRNRFLSFIVIRSFLEQLFNDTSGGFFVEAGAFDGEGISNSLWLEKEKGWMGLLVEPNNLVHDALRSKNRKAWFAPVCLSRNNYPQLVTIEGTSGHSKIIGGSSKKDGEVKTNFGFYQQSQCLPLFTLLTALNVSRVDFLSLDTEGGELETLMNFPFDKIEIDFLTIEHHPRKQMKTSMKNDDKNLISLNEMIRQKYDQRYIEKRKSVVEYLEDQDLIQFMLGKGYYLLDIFCVPITDYFFIRIGSKLFNKLKVPDAVLKRKSVCSDKVIKFDSPALDSSTLLRFRDLHHYPNLTYRDNFPRIQLTYI